MEKFGVDAIFTPERPVFSVRGAVVTNIAHIPAALTAVMRENGVRPDFAAEGTMELKAWFGASAGVAVPGELDLPVVEALAPYGEQVAALNRQIGAIYPRQSLKDASGETEGVASMPFGVRTKSGSPRRLRSRLMSSST